MNWYPKAIQRLGPSVKVQSGRNPARGVVCHSMVGPRSAAYTVLDNVTGDRKTVGWHFSVMKDGTVEQHYPLDARVHHAGNLFANNNYIGIEHEGGLSPVTEPLTAKQREASIALVRWIAAQSGWIPSRTGQKTLWEHNEVSDTGTQCPSGRIPWEAYLGEVMPPKAGPLDWGTFYVNGAVPVRIERRNATTLTYVYEVRKHVKG